MTKVLPTAPRVLMYHSVSPSTVPDPHALRVHPDRLDRQLAHLRRRGLRGVSMAQWLEAVEQGEARRLVALTFDDGYRDFVDWAMPVLARHAMTASVYVVTGKLGGRSDWDADHAMPLLTADDLLAVVAEGHEVGSHSMTHPPLEGATSEVVAREVGESRAFLADLLGSDVGGFCFPYGSSDAAARHVVADAGYSYALVTDDHSDPGRHAVPRIFVGQRDSALRLEAKFVRHRLRALRSTAAPSTGPRPS